MPYCTQNDLENLIPVSELAELTSDSGDNPNSGLIAEIIDRVGAEIDAYISKRYIIPLLTIPNIIKALSVDMAIYHLYTRRSAVPIIRQTKYQDAINFLKDVALGKANIIGQEGNDILEKSSNLVSVNGSQQIFSRADWGNY